MTMPSEFHQPRPVNARLVTKTSFPNPKQAIALMFLLWHAENKPGLLEYGVQSGTGITLDGNQLEDLSELIESNTSNPPSRSDIEKWTTNNPLLTAQIESLNAAFELIWHLGSFAFTDQGLNRSAERTGGKRFPKSISFTSNLDIVDACVERDMQAYVAVMLNWISDGGWPTDNAMEASVVKTLAAFAEVSFYKAGKGDDNIVYTPHNVYEQFNNGADRVELTAQGEERQGPTRIFAALVKDGLNPYLASAGQSVALAQTTTPDIVREYSYRAEASLGLSRLEVSVRESAMAETESEFDQNLSWNLIVFGAPGTGKSHDLDIKAKENFPNPGQIVRVTFHPEYTYSQFVGSYKPYVAFDESALKDADSEKSLADVYRDGKIKYCYEFGPFLETYVQALLHPEIKYVLLIEELNRANPAAAFGDVFQLLDRDAAGNSKYPVSMPDDMRGELWKRLYESTFLPEDPSMKRYSWEEADKAAKTLSLPPNMYLWATMNSADQGVYPMDTAFKRRWSFEYKDINHGYEAIRDVYVPLGADGHMVNWDDLRRNINALLLDDCKVNEDKLLGPFFIAPETLADPDAFATAFKDKVLLYLCEDAAKMKRPLLFRGCKDRTTITYSYICGEFDSRGEEIFGLSLGEE